MDRKNRLKEAYKYLQSIGKIHTQKGFADALGKAEGTISRAFNGDEKALTDNLFVQITLSFPGLFNLDYLLTGEGSLLVEQKDDPAIPSKMQDMIDQYKQEIKRLTDSIEPYKQEIQRLNNTVDNQREIIEDLKMLVNNFKNQYRYIQPDDDNPFVSDNTPVNVFDKKNSIK